METENGNGKRKREMVVTAIRTQYKLSYINARARVASHHWVGIKPGFWTGLMN